MRKFTYLPVALACFALASCGTGNTKSQTAGIRPENLDTTASPGTSFYQFACGGWMANNPLTDEYGRFGSFDQLRENNREQLNDLIEEIAAKKQEQGSIPYKIATVYNQVLDTVKRNADGIEPIREDLAQIAALQSSEELKAYMAKKRPTGFSPYFGFYVSGDQKNSSMNILNIVQGRLGMGNRDYYLEQDDHSKELRTKYVEHMGKMFRLVGFSESEAQAKAGSVMAMETRLAKVMYSPVELRDPERNYNKMTMAELEKNIPGMDWETYFSAVGLGGMPEVVVKQIEPLQEVLTMINTLPMSDQIAYLEWNLINGAANSLSDDLDKQDFEFYGKALQDKQEMQPLWKRAVSSVDGFLGEAVGQMYVEKHFPPAAKERMLSLVENLKLALSDRIQGLEWMSEETKVQAQEKLATFIVKIGYPDKWIDYSALDIQEDSYWANIKRANLLNFNMYTIGKVGKPVDKTEWLMNPQTVNAYYMPTTNEICFPAGILQYPFFDMDADDAFNYGAIGVVIGHEMTHGFDDSGRKYDKNGNMADWWTTEDAEKFNARADKLVEYYDQIEVLSGLNANGRFTLGENIADQGGVVVAYGAYKKAMESAPLEEKEGFTPDQRFFLSYAGVWAGNIRDEEIRRLTRIDPHSLGKWRVDGALPHIDAWYDAFNITSEDPMYIAPEERAVVW